MRVGRLVAAKGGKLHTVGPGETLGSAATLMQQHRIGSLIVVGDDGRLVGLLTEPDIVAAVAGHGADAVELQVQTVMRLEPPRCSTFDTIERAMAAMTDHRTRHLPVFDDDALVGVLSIGDVVKQRLAELENESRLADNFLMWSR
jgi:CBS domain-containing protein